MALILVGSLIMIGGPRTVRVLTKGWYSSHQVLEHQRQIDAGQERLERLQREVAYARTSEGRDVEAKRRFGVAPSDEIWITVEADGPARRQRKPQSAADRVRLWLTDAGSRFVDRVRETATVLSYWVGLSEVDQSVAVPVIEEPPSDDTTDSDDPPEQDASGEAGSEQGAADDGGDPQ
jgi:hypothetical protein